MDLLLRSLFLQLFLSCCLFMLVSSAPDSVTSTVGHDCDLPCSGPQGKVLVLEWTKDGRQLLLYRNDRISEKSQHQSFRGRVHLRDTELRRGAMTVTLKNLTLEDTGTYFCKGLVQTSGGKQERFIREVHLRVSESTEGHYAARKDEREGQDLNDQKLTHSDTDVVTVAANRKHLAVTSGVSESTEAAQSEKRLPDSDVPEAANRKHLPLILGVTSAVVVCAVAAGVYWKRKTINDLLQKKKNPDSPDSPPTTPTSPTTPTTPTDSFTPLIKTPSEMNSPLRAVTLFEGS